MNRYESIVDETLFDDFPARCGATWMNHVANTCGIKSALGFANLFCPAVVEEDGCILIAEFYRGGVSELRRSGKTTREIERFINSWSLASLLKSTPEQSVSDADLKAFARAVQYFWQLRMRTLFPQKDIVVEIAEGIMGEEGLAVTVYQRNSS